LSELAQVLSFVPLDLGAAVSALHDALPPGSCLPWGRLRLGVCDPWRPCDRWSGAPETWAHAIVVADPGDPPWTDEAAAALAERLGIARRRAPLTAAEVIAHAHGDALVVVHADATPEAYVALYRERRLRFSLHRREPGWLARCDGHVVSIDDRAETFAEGDRAGVLLAGLCRWLATPIELSPEERLFLPETLADLGPRFREILYGGEFVDARPRSLRSAAR
jgi:hypothetical protein